MSGVYRPANEAELSSMASLGPLAEGPQDHKDSHR
jgi:hypothetical protein